jgi:hypothetical protein
MKRFAASIEIKAPPEAVWRVLADIGGWPGWDPNTDRAEGLMEKGRTPSFAFTYAPGRNLQVEITAIDEPFLLEWTGGNEGLKGVRTHRIAPAGENSLVEVSQEFSGSAVQTVHLPDLDKAVGEFCAALKKRVETGSSWKEATPEMLEQD